MNSITLLSDARYFEEGSSGVSHLRQLLDSKHPKDKLEAMKSLLARMTLGRDVSSFFPDVVKNVIVDHVEVKKLVYMYLIHYAEEKQDLALLTINTFQKDLQSPSQRIRANAMRAMASIRIPVAIPLVMIALKTAVKDNSSYVRRAAASAIPKLNSCEGLEPENKEMLIEFIMELLTNTEPIVLGAAMFAFQEVCPTRFDLLHQHFRKICHLLADFDDWGQQVAIETLTRYGRTQFISPFKEGDDNTTKKPVLLSIPNSTPSSTAGSPRVGAASTGGGSGGKDKKKHKEKSFYSDDEDEENTNKPDDSDKDSNDSDGSSKKKKSKGGKSKKKSDDEEGDDDDSDNDPLGAKMAARALSPLDYTRLDEDHSLLLKQAALLLQTSNSGVLMAIVTLYWVLAPTNELSKIVRPFVRMSRNKRSLMYVILANISTMASVKPDLFRPYLKDFFINTSDPLYVRELKLDIICHLATDLTMPQILKEFQAYTVDPEKDFVCKVIQSIGRCTQFIPTIAERAMNTLSKLVLSPTDSVVAQSVVVIVRQLLPFSPAESVPVIVKRMTRLLDQVKIPMARTAIVWMIGEYREHIVKLAPDTLRKLAKTFQDEEISVKMQVLNLSVKLFLSNPKQTSLLFKFIMDLCKYDVNYDLRDRARLFRSLFFKKKAAAPSSPSPSESALGAPGDQGIEVKENMKSVLLVPKPSPTIPEPFSLRHKYTLGSLSHIISQPAVDYDPLSDFPLAAPDPSTRNPKPTQKELDDAEKAAKKAERSEKKSKGGKKSRKSNGSTTGSNASDSEDEDSSAKSSDFSSFDSQSEGENEEESDDSSNGDDDGSGSDGSKEKSDEDEEDENSEEREHEKDKDLEAEETDDEDEEQQQQLKKKREKEKEKAKKEKEKRKGKGKSADSDEEPEAEDDEEEGDDELELDLSHQAKIKQKEKEKKEAEKQQKEKEKEEKTKEKEEKAKERETAQKEKEKAKEKEREKEKEKDPPKEKVKSGKEKPPSAPKQPEPADLLDFSAVNFGPTVDASASSNAAAASAASLSSPSSSASSTSPEPKPLDITVPTLYEAKGLYPKQGLQGVLLNPVLSGGLEISFAFSRKPSLYSNRMNAIDIRFVNQSNNSFTEIQMVEENQSLRGDSMGLDEVGVGFNLQVGDSHDAKIHVGFKGRAENRIFTIFVGSQKHQLKLIPTVGELIRPRPISHQAFGEKQKKLSGMQESTLSVTCNNVGAIPQAILYHFNMAPLAPHATGVWRFAADLLHDDSIVLIQCVVKDNTTTKGSGAVVVQVNCEDFMFAGHLIELAKKALMNAPN